MNREKIINLLFEHLNKNLDYAVLSKTEDIYSENHDIDLIVSSFKDFMNIIRPYLHKNNIKIVQLIKHNNFGHHIFFINISKGKIFSFNFDIYENILFKNKILFTSKFLLNSRIKNKKFFSLSNESQFIYYLVKILLKENFSNLNLNYLKEFLSKNNKNIASLFPNSSKLIYKSIINIDSNFFYRNKFILSKELKSNLPFFKKYYYYKIGIFFERIFNPNGLIIALIGPDGVGKSTLIKKFSEQNLPFRNFYYYHLSPRVNYNPFVLSSFRMIRKEPYNIFLSLLKLVYFVFEYFLHYPKILILKIKSSLIIFDRYYYDLLVDSSRLRIKQNIVINFLLKIIPKPDIVFTVLANPILINHRKNENSLSITKNLVDKYSKNSELFNFHIILNDKNIDLSIKDFNLVIYDKLIKKYENL